jgi:hypothetical protein
VNAASSISNARFLFAAGAAALSELRFRGSLRTKFRFLRAQPIVVFLALHRIGEHCVCGVDDRHLFVCLGVAIAIRVPFVGKCLVRGTDNSGGAFRATFRLS